MVTRHGAAPAPPDEIDITPPEQAELLAIARQALRVAVGAEPAAALGDRLEHRMRHDATGRRAAAFVTLTVGGELRGCIGTLDPTTPVGEAVAWAALQAARRDPRFRPVEAAELPGIAVAVSVLGPTRLLDDPLGFEPGRDGLVVEAGGRHGLLLPEVADHAGLDARGMLEATCRKAGLPAAAWRDPGTIVLAFRTARFEGPAVDPATAEGQSGARAPAGSRAG